jgi:hypothetical protein
MSRSSIFVLVSLLVIASSIAGCSDSDSGQSIASKSSLVIDNTTTLSDVRAQLQDSPPAAGNPKPQKLSPAAEKAISEGMVEIKDPAVQACTDQRIAVIKKERGDSESGISFDVYNEAAVACGFNL